MVCSHVSGRSAATYLVNCENKASSGQMKLELNSYACFVGHPAVKENVYPKAVYVFFLGKLLVFKCISIP
jgi:hypothetical protein